MRALAILLMGCTSSAPGAKDDTTGGADDSAAPVDIPTWHQDVASVVERSCNGCHDHRVAGPVTWETEAEIQAWAPLIAEEVASGSMPPWQADDGCNTYEGDFSLTEAERAAIVAWGENGAPMGDPDAAAPLPEAFQPQTLAERDIELHLPGTYTPKADVDDDYRCFLLEWPYEETVRVTAYEMLPDTPAVHHIIPFRIDPEDADYYRALDDAEEGEGYTCYGGPGGDLEQVARLGWLGAWAPGTDATTLPEGTGIRMKPGSLIAFQVHYNMAHLDAAAGPDQSGVAFQVSDEVDGWADVQPWTEVAWVAGFGMDIPANTQGVTHEFTYELDDSDDFRFHTTLIHMHKMGRAARMWVEHDDGSETCLLQQSNYDFNWQRDYRFTDPVDVGPGDTIKLRCEWDNDTDQDVSWGDGTGDEMCLGVTLITE